MIYRQAHSHYSFYLLKPEAYVFGKVGHIKQRIIDAGFNIVSHQKIHLAFTDLMAMYPNFIARITMSLRLPFLMDLDLYIIEGNNVIENLNQLKYEIRRELMGSSLGGYLHTPDSATECERHLSILTDGAMPQREK